MKRYTVRSTFKDAKGRDLFHSKTFDGTAEDARCALVDAHAEMARLGAADGRVDSISSVVSGPNEEISTTDYLDELGSGASTSGLMHEVTPEQLERVRTPTIDPARDGFAADGLYGGGIGANRATGGVVQSHDTFRDVGLGDAEGSGKGAASTEQVSGATAGKGGADPRSNSLDDIKVPEWITPGMRDAWRRARQPGVPMMPTPSEFTEEALKKFFGVPEPKTFQDFVTKEMFPDSDYNLGAGKVYIDGDLKGQVKEFNIKITDHDTSPLQRTRKTVGDIIKESRRAGKPTLLDMTRIMGFPLLPAQREMMAKMYEAGSKKYEARILGHWADEEETEE